MLWNQTLAFGCHPLQSGEAGSSPVVPAIPKDLTRLQKPEKKKKQKKIIERPRGVSGGPGAAPNRSQPNAFHLRPLPQGASSVRHHSR